MKACILVEDKEKGWLRIPLSKAEIGDVADLAYVIDKPTWDTLKLNKMEKNVANFFHKMEFLLHDVVNEGRVYRCSKDGKWILNKQPCYLIKAPQWRKSNAKQKL